VYPADHPLSVSQNMHWSWTQGYIFLKMEGRYDSDNDGVVEATDNTFAYHCTSDALRRDVELEVHQDALSGGALVIDLDLDLANIISPVDIQSIPFAEGADPLNRTMMDSLATAITLP
ncbi:MAG: MbnP family protein, partial [Flavobacteriales bacterium]